MVQSGNACGKLIFINMHILIKWARSWSWPLNVMRKARQFGVCVSPPVRSRQQDARARVSNLTGFLFLDTKPYVYECNSKMVPALSFALTFVCFLLQTRGKYPFFFLQKKMESFRKMKLHTVIINKQLSVCSRMTWISRENPRSQLQESWCSK